MLQTGNTIKDKYSIRTKIEIFTYYFVCLSNSFVSKWECKETFKDINLRMENIETGHKREMKHIFRLDITFKERLTHFSRWSE